MIKRRRHHAQQVGAVTDEAALLCVRAGAEDRTRNRQQVQADNRRAHRVHQHHPPRPAPVPPRYTPHNEYRRDRQDHIDQLQDMSTGAKHEEQHREGEVYALPPASLSTCGMEGEVQQRPHIQRHSPRHHQPGMTARQMRLERRRGHVHQPGQQRGCFSPQQIPRQKISRPAVERHVQQHRDIRRSGQRQHKRQQPRREELLRVRPQQHAALDAVGIPQQRLEEHGLSCPQRVVIPPDMPRHLAAVAVLEACQMRRKLRRQRPRQEHRHQQIKQVWCKKDEWARGRG